MAAYSVLIRRISTAEINRVQREGDYSRWAYFVDESSAKVGVIFANDLTFGAYIVADEPAPRLEQYGLEAIKDLTLTPDPQLLVLTVGDNLFQAAVFVNPASVLEDEFSTTFNYDIAKDWQHFLRTRQVGMGEDPARIRAKRIFIGVVVAIVVLLIIIAVA